MADPRHDALEVLRRAWSELPAPSPHKQLADEDATTRAAVAWTRDAYEALEPPAPVQRLRPADPPRQRVRRLWQRPAAAAAVLFALALGLQLRPAGGGAAPVPAVPDAVDAGPRLVAVSDDHLELRSGPVRLVLITAQPPAN